MAYIKITLSTPHRFKEIKEYRDYLKEKKVIQKKYPSKPWNNIPKRGPRKIVEPFDEKWWAELQSYKKEMLDLLFTPNGNFQQFTWQLLSEKEDAERENRARGFRRSIYY
jgi:hypothetical protein